ncbi:hypothetical protein MAPG_09767 [Magnaporthiopsis poae ATCC 64411]|uniref:Uncharacterized protein n=1 Tax=Magnaporthiopsis poae (strain ATCC 64411 / 73-15) TaxID=644358 RepID=A0A0C4EAT7_MAGP6|nr:hypothetical protein MAPG_09767 [Magnaporthiopsis poae ATCC 64411]
MSTNEKQNVSPLPAVGPREDRGDKTKEIDGTGMRETDGIDSKKTPGIKGEFSPQRTLRKSVLFTSFHLLPTALAIFCLISLFLVMFSGTKLAGSADTSHGSSGAILLSDIAVVSFDGLIEQPSGYAVTFHWFMNGFGWTYPTQDSASLVYANRGPIQETQLSLPGDIFYAAGQLHGPGCDKFAAYNASHACYPAFLNRVFPDAKNGTRAGNNDDMLRYRPDREFPSDLPLSLHYIAVWLTMLALAVEAWFLLSRSRRLFSSRLVGILLLLCCRLATTTTTTTTAAATK